MTSGNDRKPPDISKPHRQETDPVSLPENADFRYDEREASEPVKEDSSRGSKSEE